MQHDGIGLLLQGFQVDDFHVRWRLLLSEARPVGQYAAAEGLQSRSRGATDAAEADDADREFAEPLWIGAFDGEAARVLDPPVVLHDPAEMRQQQGDGMVGDFLHAVVRHVGDPGAAPGGAVHGDIVETDAEAGDDAQVFRGFDGSGGNRRPAGNDGGRIGFGDQRLDVLGTARRHRAGDQFDAGRGEDRLLDLKVGPGVVGQHDPVAAGFLVHCHCRMHSLG
ncbi:hypothetical protein D3C81_1009890 [compost metagenome]